MSELAKKKKTQAGYRSYVTKINETHTILEKFEEEKEGVGGEKNRKRGDWGKGKLRERSTYSQNPHNSMFLRSKSGCKMLIGRDMSRGTVRCSLAVKLASVC